MNRVGIVLAGRYQLVEQLGSGGMADVYKASDRKLNRYVAVKILRHEYSEDNSFITKFQQEAMAAASIQSPYVVNVYDVGEENGINYIVMELADGVTLKEYIQKKGKLEIVEAINIAMQIVTGIREAHAHGIIHRDIKPQNVMISPDGKAKVMDFGIAKAVTAQTITANTVGSVHYISPEQARGSACDERCDIYSIGITMYEMITGRVPFDGDSTVAIALAHIKEPITPPSVYEPMIPVSLEKIIMKCTQKKPELRYASADELIDDLKKALMTPDEDFVKEVVLAQDGGTRIFSEEDTKKIKKVAGASTPVRTQEEEDYQLGLEEEDAEEMDEEEEETDGKMEKIVLGIGIVALLAVLLIAGILVSRAFNLFSSGRGNSSQTAQETAGSLSADEVLMPPVAGKTREDAIDLLRRRGLENYHVEQQASSDVEENIVISASVSAGETVSKNAQIILYVSSGKDTVPIPKIIGIEEEAARKALEGLRLKVESETVYSDDVEVGEVVSCNPGVGEEVKRGTLVMIQISQGPDPMVAVPSVIGLTQAAAQTRLSGENLKYKISEDYDDTMPLGKVVSQSVNAGEKVEKGTTIELVISLGPKDVKVTVPNLLNMTQDAAQTALKDRNLKLGHVTTQHDDSVREGRVISQSIDSGEEVDSGTGIDIVISLGPAMSTVPNVEGMSEKAALSSLKKNGLTGSKLGEESSSLPKGYVTRTTIRSGSTVEPGTTVSYYVSSGNSDGDGN